MSPARVLAGLLLAALAATAGCASLERGLAEEAVAPAGLRLPRDYEVALEEVRIVMDDGVALAATLAEPMGDPEELFPAVIVIHGWGGSRDGAPGERERGASRETTGALAERLARIGFVAVAYDVRGFGESEGVTSLAGAREIEDVRRVIDWVEANAPVEAGNIGVTGFSYGGGHSYLVALADSRVRAIAPWYGWIDLAEGLLPGRVPKHGWNTFLLAYGAPSAQGQYDPQLYDWYLRGLARTDMDPVVEGLTARSVANRLADYTIPVLLVEGLRESLFPQTWEAYRALRGPKMLYTYEGGHGSFDGEAWNLTERWFRHWLRGESTGLMQEAPVRVLAPWSGEVVPYPAYPAPGTVEARFIGTARGGLVEESEASTEAARLPFLNTLASGRFDEPAVLSDSGSARPSPLPGEARAAPAGEVARFVTDAFPAQRLLFGTPRLAGNFTSATSDLQVVARLYDLAPDGTIVLLSRGGADASPVAAGEVTPLAFPLTRHHWRIETGHRLVLEVAASDVTYTAPLPRPFTAEALVGGENGIALTLPLL